MKDKIPVPADLLARERSYGRFHSALEIIVLRLKHGHAAV
jgi:hypothetical protein